MLRLSWLISIGISLFGVMIIQHFFTLSPDGESSGGNLGAVGLALVLPFLLLSLFITFRFALQVSRRSKDTIMRNILLIFGFALIGVFIYYAIDYRNEAYEALGGTTLDKTSTIYGYPVLNQYTNHIFLNFYTFAIIHTVSAVIGGMIGVFKSDDTPPIETFDNE